MYKPALTIGIISAMIAVIIGAFGAHVLSKLLEHEQYTVFLTAVRFHFYHSFALVFTGILYKSFPYKATRLATIFFTFGIFLFCGSLLLMNALSLVHMGIGPVGILTPIGGLGFILGWLFLLLGIIKKEIA